MSGTKYADLPDIVSPSQFHSFARSFSTVFIQDTAPDVYETEDVYPFSQSAVCPCSLFFSAHK